MFGSSLTLPLGLLLGFGLVLAASAGLVVRSSSVLAHKAGLTNFAIGFLLLGLLTSTPEMFVALQSGVDGVPQLSLGNLIGGSILLLSLVMGVSSVILGRITLDHGLKFREIVFSCAVIMAPAAVIWDGNLTRADGAFLVGLYLFHAFLLNSDGRKKRLYRNSGSFIGVWHALATLGIGFVGMAISSRVMVESAQVLTAMFHIPPFVFGLLLLSVGTNLPEFALAFEGAVLKRETVAFGDFLGSSAANTLILGVLAMAVPFEVATRQRLWVSLALLVGVTLFFVRAVSTRRDISRKEGLGLLFFYVIFIVFELMYGL